MSGVMGHKLLTIKMVVLFSTRWHKVTGKKCPINNWMTVEIQCLDETGTMRTFQKTYENWMGVVTNHIETIAQQIKRFLPGCQVRYERLSDQHYGKILPYFEDRLKTGKLDTVFKPFYKVFVSAPLEAVGQFFDLYKISYYEDHDWLVRIYIDLCTRFQTYDGFYYRWYDVDPDEPELLKSFHMRVDILEIPDWTFAAFDLETICLANESNRVPTGMDAQDRIVMISIVTWNRREYHEYVLYLDPREDPAPPLFPDQTHFYPYDSERALLQQFHKIITPCHVLTGYNINRYDIPFIFARLWWLNLPHWLQQYTSCKVGLDIVTTFQDKIVIDIYHYFKIFSNYDLIGHKLDDVAKVKLGEGKIPVHATGIHAWYQQKSILTTELCRETDRGKCFERLRPPKLSEWKFGTFLEYIRYCLRDSVLVYKLFQKENVLTFLMIRANFAAVPVVSALHLGNPGFLLEMFKTYGTLLGFFINAKFFYNQTNMSEYAPLFDKKTKKYQAALNYCSQSMAQFDDTVLVDFKSMYPSIFFSLNLCYGSCTLAKGSRYLALPKAVQSKVETIQYKIHTDDEFKKVLDPEYEAEYYRYPPFRQDPEAYVMIHYTGTVCFLPKIVENFLQRRQTHQRLFKETGNILHYNTQLCIKILNNSLYGTTGSTFSKLGYLPLAMSTVLIARYQLLAIYHYFQRRGCRGIYADTDGLMVQGWPHNNCDAVNRYLKHLHHVELEFESRFQRVLLISKKRYIYVTMNGKIVMKAFKKKVNELNRYLTHQFVHAVMALPSGSPGPESEGWQLWVQTLQHGYYMCRDPSENAMAQKIQELEHYKSTACVATKFLKKYTEHTGDYIEYIYHRADISQKAAKQWIVDVKDCRQVDFEQLIMGQKELYIKILNTGYWRTHNASEQCAWVLNGMRWKCFMHVELLYVYETLKTVQSPHDDTLIRFPDTLKTFRFLLHNTVKDFTFGINDHFVKQKSAVVKRAKPAIRSKRAKSSSAI